MSPGPSPRASAPPTDGQGAHTESMPPPPSSAGLPLVSLVLGGCGLVGYLLGVAHGPGPMVFFLTGLGIMPWARLLGLATEALAYRTPAEVYFGAPDHRVRCGAEKGRSATPTTTEKGDTPTLEIPFSLC